MTHPVLRPAAPMKTMPLCPAWFFGGPHQWHNAGGRQPCAVKRRQKPPYQHKFTTCHEWGDDGRCVHCHKTVAQITVKKSNDARCLGCGKTKAELLAMAARGEQPRLECEDFGHKVERKARRPHPFVRLVVDNTRRRGGQEPCRLKRATGDTA